MSFQRDSDSPLKRSHPLNSTAQQTFGDAFFQATGVAKYRPEYRLKTVSLRESRDGWPAGTVGVIVEPFGDAALVEISGEYGVTLAMLSVPYDCLDVREGPLEHLRAHTEQITRPDKQDGPLVASIKAIMRKGLPESSE